MNSSAEIKHLLARHGLAARKSLGQNFLTDSTVVARIVAAVDIKPQDVVVEIGPGIGVLTRALAAAGARVVAIEVDRGLAGLVAQELAYSNVQVEIADALETDLDALVRGLQEREQKYKVVGNLPYYVTSPLLLHLLQRQRNMTMAVVMVQQEVAARILSAPGSRTYGPLSVAVQFRSLPELVTTVSREAFWPQPKVDSAVVRLVVREQPAVEVPDEELFFQVVRGAFTQRRKTMANSLAAVPLGLSKDEARQALAQGGIPWEYRAENLSLAQWAALTWQLQRILSRPR
ncbi:MAG: 16S rRNA (adenine(1518)-N(6)/adenine(1519)-N(6))-dimethyltransferase RsmA [Clostridia bacterium]|nr:MAG: 16S rRNA (adenine(1518)-N(6)/adenine(1519)-N(6))-dimethyltransferase RsmA [Clostridia bacterium]